jgi:hypothetical protein
LRSFRPAAFHRARRAYCVAGLRGGALAQQRSEALLRHRLTEQEALAVVAAHADQGERVGCFLDADRHGHAVEIMREVDDGLAQRRIDLVGAAIGDEGAVELELGKRQRLEPYQRRIAAAEVVDRKLDVEMRELRGKIGRQREIGDDLLLGDVDDEARPFFEFRPVSLHDASNVELDQRIDRHVDGHPQIDAELRKSEIRKRRASIAGHQHAMMRVARANASAPTSCFLRRSIFG